MKEVQSLWVGPKLSILEVMCIKSFQRVGHTFILYTYEKVKNVPKGTVIKDANTIIKKKNLFDFKSSFLPFSDIFRYTMLYKNGGYWVDLDMIALKLLDFKEPYVFSAERTIQKGPYRNRTKKEVPHIGILKAPKHSEFYKELSELCLSQIDKVKETIQFMRILRTLLDKYKYHKYVKNAKLFCPLDWWHTKDAFYVTDTFKEKYGVKGYTISSVLKNAYTIHMWRHLMYNRHKMDLTKTYGKDTLWEILKTMIDSKPKRLTKKKSTKR